MKKQNKASVYVITNNNGMSKIGISRTPEKRLATLQTASPYKLDMTYLAAHSHAERVEQEAHKLLKKHRSHGEWFACAPCIAEDAVNRAAARIGRPVVQIKDGKMVEAPKTGHMRLYVLIFFITWATMTAALHNALLR
jgi:predicted GIY-YIG superfamily endonuclease